MSRLFKRLAFVAATLAIAAIGAYACTPGAEGTSTDPPSPSDGPTQTHTRAPIPTGTPTQTASPTPSATLAPHMECLSRYGYHAEAGTWGDQFSEQATSSPVPDDGRQPDGVQATESPTIDGASAAMDPTWTPTGQPDSGFTLSPLFTPEVRFWAAEIYRWSGIYGIDPDLVATVMQIESCGHPMLVSPAGAIGLFQVMPFHFSYGEDPFDPDTNARRGLPLLHRGIELSLGQTDLALAIYNGGAGLLSQDPEEWPQETRDYVTWGTGILADIKAGNLLSTSMQIWLEAGGDIMCLSSCLALAAPPRIGEP